MVCNGTVLETDKGPLPILQDNSFEFFWSTEEVIYRAITSIDGGDLDDDQLDELLITAQGQGVYVLDTIDGVLAIQKVNQPFEDWETDPSHPYPLDYYVDYMKASSPAVSFDAGNPPYNTYAAAEIDGQFAMIQYQDAEVDPKDRPQYAIYDFGQDEEATGNGVIDQYIGSTPYFHDLEIRMNLDFPDYTISISKDAETWYEIPSSMIYSRYVSSQTYDLQIDVDSILADNMIDYFRYIKFNVTSTGYVSIDSIQTLIANTPINTGQSAVIGEMVFKGDETPQTAGLIGTVDGTIIAIVYDTANSRYNVVWDSYKDEAYKLNKNLFDLAIIKNRNTFPAWIDEDTSGLDWDLTSTQMFSYTAENFVNYKYDTNLEYIITTSSPGDVRVYTQSSYNSEPQYNSELTQMLFQTSNFGSSYSVDSYINNRIANGAQRFAFSLVPVEGNYPRNNLAVSGLLDDVDPVNNPFWLFVSSWDGDVTHQGVNQHVSFNGATDAAIFFLEETKSGDSDYPSECGTYSFSTCTYFNPLLDANDQITTLSESELSGILTPIFKQSTWLPQIAAADFIGNDVSDLVLTNGKLHLLEASHEMADDAKTDAKDNLQYRPIDHAIYAGYENLDYTYKSEYFKDINDNARGREWTYANPVDLDTDGDMDLILGFARYDDVNYGFDSHNYGITYFENEGTSKYPIWKELATAVNNMDTETNFAVNGYVDPQVIFNTYNIDGEVLNPTLGYHPLLKSDKPSQMLMFQSTSSTSIYPGKLKSLLADYEPPTSILAATYPSVRRLDINLKYHTTSYYLPPVSISITTKNMGYHIMETWNNEYELRDWTLSMD
ncbi:MAG: hypothetical protein ACXAD7_25435, partial [Candidatus Kariarchaeaceae archaeon]